MPSAQHNESPVEAPALERLLRKEQVAAWLNVSPRTVSYWAWTGKLLSVRTPGGQYRFRPSDVAAHLAQAEVAV